MKKHYIITIVVTVMIGLPIVLVYLRQSFIQPTVEQDKDRRLAIRDMQRAYSAPITFYGKVVDEKNNPIAGASVHYSVANNPLTDGAKHEGTSDNNGLFSISKIKGASLYVTVWKKGYYPIENLSGGAFAYGVPPSSNIDRPIPTKDNPAIFVLRKMGETVPLIPVDRDVMMPKDGTPVEISLSTGTVVSEGEGDIVVECWTQNQGFDPNLCEHYDWRFRLTIPDGGLVERTDEFAFEAPETGYRSMIELNMPKDSPEWKNVFQGEYFLKLKDNRYARMNFRVISGGAHFAVVTSYLNPTPGIRNLEYDPEKAIKPQR